MAGCASKGQHCCCKITQAFPCGKDLQLFDTTLNLPLKVGAFGVFFPKADGKTAGGAAVAAEDMSR